MPLMIIYIATCLDNLPSPGKLLLITFDSASGYNESILNRIPIKKKNYKVDYCYIAANYWLIDNEFAIFGCLLVYNYSGKGCLK